jgi:AcrR family transcriptional regulator
VVLPVLTPLADRALTALYRDADAAGRQAQRQIVLDAASALMQSDGPDALTMRRIAGEVDCSTSVLYTMFGDKAGVAEALWLEGFSRLHAALAEVRGVDPVDRLRALGTASRANALSNRSYYAVMFGRLGRHALGLAENAARGTP